MDLTNPLLDQGELPAFSAIRPQHVNPALDRVLADYRADVERLVADPQARDFSRLLAPLEHWEERLGRVFSPVSHLHGVKDSPELREAYAAAIEKLTEHATELGQHRGLYEAVKALRESPDFENLDRARRTLVEDSLRGFRLSGVALQEPARSRFKAIQAELSKLETGFEEAVLDATDAWTRPLEEAELAGLPESARRMLRGQARDKGRDGWLATLKGPVVQALLTYADTRALREEVYRAYNTRASDQGPHAGQFDNGERIARILALRHEAARLLGFPSKAHLSLADKMAGTPERVLGFLRELVAKARPVAERELAELREFARAELGLDDLQPWDVSWASEKLRQRRFDFSEEQLKPWFPLPEVMRGLFTVAERVFGVRLVERSGVDTWHPDVHYFDVLDADGTVRAGVYLDHYARTGKRGGAWMDVCRSRLRDGEAEYRPVAYLTCNFPPPAEGKPSLLTHDDVVTLFHEFGHGLHHLLTEVDWPSVGGISGVEWDAVELPSQFMENFAWKREALDLFAKHWQTGERLPDDLYAKMLAARHFHAGLFLVRQLEFALYDFRLHLEYDPARGPRTLELLEEVRDEVAVVRPPAWHRFPHAFTHIFAGGYAAGYYSYLWAEVLSADAFAAFEEAGIFDRATGERYRREILAVGGSRPALESFVAFRGREPEPEALLRSYGLAA
ncbi:M3 family metallopeptidase [Arenimonas fontis]|uniref:oligopeptidase A n=1 Tax=Arenimonas fontis TaxID=2608255 RepID=A0A5B2ZBM0_9GAMM|nr:M3 family metallopeptidase [Arenimonas fontis]KAA2284680.1 M3 family metallopeptidase [Arenimonas fontis]